MIKNYTPHSITIIGELHSFEIPPEPNPIRLSTKTVEVGCHDGIPLTRTVFGDPEGLPDPEKDTLLIVSALVKLALPHRRDLVVPNETVRDPQGRVIGCRSLGL